MLKTRVILTDVTNLSDARYAVGMGVEYIGFNLDPQHPNYVTANEAKAISSWLAGARIVVETGHNSQIAVEDYNPDVVIATEPGLLAQYEHSALRLRANEIQTGTLPPAEFYLVELSVAFWQDGQLDNLHALCRQQQVFIDSDFSSITVQAVLEKLQPAGIVLHGSHEDKPGLSRYEGIAEVLEALEVD